MIGLTITGLDEWTDRGDIERLHRAFPDVELGILWSASRSQDPEQWRYPNKSKVLHLLGVCQSVGVAHALHVCGSQARMDTLRGLPPAGLVGHGCRIQINGDVDASELRAACELYPDHRIITQHVPGGELVRVDKENHDVLMDSSGGRGQSPGYWFRPRTHKPVGFAGGLGPDNFRQEFLKILSVAHLGDWVDMETHVRTDDRLDFEKVGEVCRLRNRALRPLKITKEDSPS